MSVIDRIDERLNESSGDIKAVAAEMTRLIMGDKDSATSKLKKMLPLNQATFEPGKEYNDAFVKLTSAIHAAINQALKAAK